MNFIWPNEVQLIILKSNQISKFNRLDWEPNTVRSALKLVFQLNRMNRKIEQFIKSAMVLKTWAVQNIPLKLYRTRPTSSTDWVENLVDQLM